MTTNRQNTELDKLEATMDAEIAHLRNQQTVSLVGAVVLIVIIFGYFFIMSGKVRELMNPDEVAYMASERIVEYLPNAQAPLQEAIRTEVPILADSLIDKLIHENIPQARLQLEAAILSGADKALDETETVFFEGVDVHLQAHGETLRSLSADLSTTEGSKAFEDALYKSLADVARDPSVKADLMGYGAALNHLERTLTYLSQETVQLTPEEETTRDLIAILRELIQRSRQSS